MKLSELLQGVAVKELHADPALELGDISYDSRKTRPGDLFVAVTGFETDGHRFIPMALEKGAACVLCQTPPEEKVPYVLVEDSRLALALCSCNYFGHPSRELVPIGITGTNGKTTTTTLLKHVLESIPGNRCGLIGTNHNMIGDRVLETERTTPESYELQKLLREMVEAGCTHLVMEVSSHSLELHRVAGIRYAVGAFTNLTQDHLDFHGTMEQYAAAKALLFAQSDRAAINLDDAWSAFMVEHCPCPAVTFSERDAGAALYAQDISLRADGVTFRVGELSVSLGIPGRFSVYNALTVLACGKALGLDMNQIAQCLSKAQGVKGRVEVVPTDGDYTILIDYAHTPDALENVLASMKEVTPGRLVAIFGCGGDRDRTKRPIMGRIGAQQADFVIITSDNPRTEDPAAIVAEVAAGLEGTDTPHQIIVDRVEAIRWAIAHHLPGDLIILAGKGHETYQIVGKTKYHMDEREIVADILRQRQAYEPADTGRECSYK